MRRKKQILVMVAMSVLALFGATAENKSNWADLAPDGVFCPGDAVLFVGDSITHGGRMGDMNHYLGHGYQAEIASRYLGYRPEMDLCFFNRGISGDDTRKLLGRWERDVINLSANESGWTAAFPSRTGRQKPGVISIMVGINDFRRCRAGKNSGGITHVEYEANIEKLVAMTRKAFPRTRIVLCEPVNLIAEEAEDFAVWRSAVRSVAARNRLCFVDFQRLFDEVLLKENSHRGYWFWDQYHPTYAAHMRMADWWIAEVRWQANEDDPEVMKCRQWIAERWRENDGNGNPVGEIGAPFPMGVPLPWIEKDSYDWFERHNSRVELARTTNPQIVFIGDSITHGWEMNDRRGDAKASFERWFGRYSTLNLGFGWDRIQNVLWRLEHGEMDGTNPKVVVIHIGTNNTAPGYKYNAAPNPPGEIADGILAVCRKVRKIAPKARIVLMKVFPRGRTPEDPYRAKVAAVNAELDRRLVRFHDDRLTVIDMHDKFVDADGNISLDLTIDYLHPTAKGYDLWGAELAPIIEKECGYERLERVARELGFDGRIVSASETNGICDVIYEYVTGSNGLVRCELALPSAAKWKGWFKGVGNVGAAGGLNKGWVHEPAERGIAAAMTDMGSSDGRCSRNPVAIRDFGHRATHLMTVGAKQLVEAYYGCRPSYSFFEGISSGGGQGLHEAQRYPDDYDGIIAGVPANLRLSIAAYFRHVYRLTHDGKGQLLFTPEQAAALSDAGVEYFKGKDEPYCDGRFLSEPRYTPEAAKGVVELAVRKCPSLDTPDMRSRAEALFADVVVDGKRVCGGLPFGAKLQTILGRESFVMNWHRGRRWDFMRDTDAEFAAACADLAPDLNADNPDLSAFAARGGRIIMYSGIEDPIVPWHHGLEYYESVVDKMGGCDEVQKFFAYYPMPGRAHTPDDWRGFGGRGVWTLDGLEKALHDWVKDGVFPGVLRGRFADGVTTVPVQPYPLKTTGSAASGWGVGRFVAAGGMRAYSMLTRGGR